MRWRYDREFKISVVAALESGKSPAQIAHERGSHPPHVISYPEPISIGYVLVGIV